MIGRCGSCGSDLGHIDGRCRNCGGPFSPRKMKEIICTGGYDSRGQFVHEGDTCPVHEGYVDVIYEVQITLPEGVRPPYPSELESVIYRGVEAINAPEAVCVENITYKLGNE